MKTSLKKAKPMTKIINE